MAYHIDHKIMIIKQAFMDKSSANFNDNTYSPPTVFTRMCNGHSPTPSVNTALGPIPHESIKIVNLEWVVVLQGREHQCSSESALDTLKRKSTHQRMRGAPSDMAFWTKSAPISRLRPYFLISHCNGVGGVVAGDFVHMIVT